MESVRLTFRKEALGTEKEQGLPGPEERAWA